MRFEVAAVSVVSDALVLHEPGESSEVVQHEPSEHHAIVPHELSESSAIVLHEDSELVPVDPVRAGRLGAEYGSQRIANLSNSVPP